MTHQSIVEFAEQVTQQRDSILRQCRGISTKALRRHLKARMDQCNRWSLLLQSSPNDVESSADSPPSWQMVRPALEELAASRILLRVSSTVLHGLGQRLDIPFAIDVAKQSTRAFEGVVHQAIGLIALREDAHCSELAALDQLGQIADRLSDLLCGALLPAFKCDDYLVDRARGHDFADTFGRDPSLVRVPMQQALKRFPRQVEAVATAIEVKQSLAACLPMLNSEPKAAGGQCVNQSGQKIGLSSTELRIVGGHTQDSLRDEAVVFPTHSFARSRRRLSPDRE